MASLAASSRRRRASSESCCSIEGSTALIAAKTGGRCLAARSICRFRPGQWALKLPSNHCSSWAFSSNPWLIERISRNVSFLFAWVHSVISNAGRNRRTVGRQSDAMPATGGMIDGLSGIARGLAAIGGAYYG